MNYTIQIVEWNKKLYLTLPVDCNNKSVKFCKKPFGRLDGDSWCMLSELENATVLNDRDVQTLDVNFVITSVKCGDLWLVIADIIGPTDKWPVTVRR